VIDLLPYKLGREDSERKGRKAQAYSVHISRQRLSRLMSMQNLATWGATGQELNQLQSRHLRVVTRYFHTTISHNVKITEKGDRPCPLPALASANPRANLKANHRPSNPPAESPNEKMKRHSNRFPPPSYLLRTLSSLLLPYMQDL
jgi:hypothetical protein